MTDIDPGAVLTALLDHALATGLFEVAMIGEFISAPPSGLCFAVWADNLGSAPGGGLSTTNAVLALTARIYFPALHNPRSEIEIHVTRAASAYLGRLNGAFTLGGQARNVDILGELGDPLLWNFGHATIDSKPSRIADLPIRVIFNDTWEQVP